MDTVRGSPSIRTVEENPRPRCLLLWPIRTDPGSVLLDPVRAIQPRCAALLVLLIAVGMYGPSVRDGFAYDGNTI